MKKYFAIILFFIHLDTIGEIVNLSPDQTNSPWIFSWDLINGECLIGEEKMDPVQLKYWLDH